MASADLSAAPPSSSGDEISFRQAFTPKLVTVLREGYGARELKADATAGLTVAIVALPLSMAIAMASGAEPEQGLFAAIIGGFFISLLGGSRFQIGGPAGAFIVLVGDVIARHGMDGMLLATFLAGVMLVATGFLRLGNYIKFIPYPVTVGFTAAIAAIIFASQIKELLGLTLPERPEGIAEELTAVAHYIGTINPRAVAVSALAIGLILAVRRWRPRWPAFLIGVAGATAAAYFLKLDVATIGSKFGAMPSSLPPPSAPPFSLEKIQAVFPDAIKFAVLGAIESLLSAVVADSMSGRRHRSNCELAAQGFANIAASFFGAMVVTGTIARTATNVRSGAHGPMSGVFHALFLLGFMLVGAGLMALAPLSALAGVLAVVAWNMAEKHEFAALLRSGRGEALALLATFFVTLFSDLMYGILIGFTISVMVFLERMSRSAHVESLAAGVPPPAPIAARDKPDQNGVPRTPYDPGLSTNPDVIVHRISGAFFFGSAQMVGAALDRIGDSRRAVVFDLSGAPQLDSTAAHTIAESALKARKRKRAVYIAGASAGARRALAQAGLHTRDAHYARNVEAALEMAQEAAQKPAE